MKLLPNLSSDEITRLETNLDKLWNEGYREELMYICYVAVDAYNEGRKKGIIKGVIEGTIKGSLVGLGTLGVVYLCKKFIDKRYGDMLNQQEKLNIETEES